MHKEHLEGVGEITYRVSKKAGRINIRYLPGEGVEVAVPAFLNMWFAKQEVRKHIPWIKEKQHEYSEIENLKKIFLPDQKYNLKHFTLMIELGNKTGRYRKKRDFIVRFKSEKEIAEPDGQEYIREAARAICRLWSKEILVPAIRSLANNHQIPIERVSIRDSKTRWGSFSTTNNVNLSLYLATIPDHLIYYVLCHELAHYKEHNHSKAFWEHLAEIIDQPLKLDRELKNYACGFVDQGLTLVS